MEPWKRNVSGVCVEDMAHTPGRKWASFIGNALFHLSDKRGLVYPSEQSGHSDDHTPGTVRYGRGSIMPVFLWRSDRGMGWNAGGTVGRRDLPDEIAFMDRNPRRT